MTMNNFAIRRGFEEQHRANAAHLYMEAFGAKIGGVLGPRGTEFIAAMLRSDHAITAVAGDGALLGIAGFKTEEGTFVGGEFSDLTDFYGWFGGAWRGLVLSVLERKIEPSCLLMDSICVDRAARGQGVGSALLDAVTEEARTRNLSEVRLDVIDSNPRAKALYERKGFIEGETSELGPLKHVFGFTSATTMRLAV